MFAWKKYIGYNCIKKDNDMSGHIFVKRNLIDIRINIIIWNIVNQQYILSMDSGEICNQKVLLLLLSVHHFLAPYDILKTIYEILYAGSANPALKIESRFHIKNKKETLNYTQLNQTMYTIIP